ncbi:MAG: substrate-binding domain-containing protein [Defluviitaleaceae bacterium]|nr:substrate-binding domain-containing protein [Defluviitaleaceae bacterium]
MIKKIAWIASRIVIILFAWIFGGYMLHRYEYFTTFWDIDNIVGMMPVAMVIVGASGVTALLWMKHTRQFAPVSAVFALLVVLAVALFPTALRGNWWINMSMSEAQEQQMDLIAFTPFVEDSKIARLDEESTLTLNADLPILDGATALFPIFAAFAEAVFDEAAFLPEHVLSTGTRSAYEALIAGKRDVIFVAGASGQQVAAARAAGADLRFTPIGREAFVFLVGNENPMYNITYQQIRNIYSGKTAYWRTLGWPEGGRIIAFQRPEGSGSQTGLQIIMGDIPIQAPQPLPCAGLIGTNSLMQQVSVIWQGVQPAIGYSYRFFATTMHANPNARVLSVDGVEPSVANIQNGIYPFVDNFYAVTNGEPSSGARLFIDWILSPQGQRIIEKTGYVPLLTTQR